jgi:hypothetical protein
MTINFKRRAIISRGLAAGTIAAAAGLIASRISLAGASLDPKDPTAKALGYVAQSTKTDAKCSNCTQFQGKAGDAEGPCTIFPGKDVAATGWCLSWIKKPT